MEILVIREINILQVGVLVFAHHLDVLIEGIVQSHGHGMHLSTVHAGPTRIVHNLGNTVAVAIGIELVVPIDKTVTLGDV